MSVFKRLYYPAGVITVISPLKAYCVSYGISRASRCEKAFRADREGRRRISVCDCEEPDVIRRL